jgi:cbb3-type cytochrome oxidase maturation protein
MTIIFFLIAASTTVAVIFLAAFVWAMRTGQYDDDHSPAVRILGDGPLKPAAPKTTSTESQLQ